MESIDIFLSGVERLLGSSFLNSDKEIKNFLMTISGEEKLREVVEFSAKDFDFEKEFDSYFGENKRPDDKTNVAVITKILFGLESGEIPTVDFLNAVYPKESVHNAYGSFLKDYVMPYAESFVNLLTGVPKSQNEEPKTAENDEYDIAAIVREAVKTIEKMRLSETASREIVSSAGGLIYTLKYNDPMLTRNAYRGFLNAMKLFKVETGLEKRLEAALALNGVL